MDGELGERDTRQEGGRDEMGGGKGRDGGVDVHVLFGADNGWKREELLLPL